MLKRSPSYESFLTSPQSPPSSPPTSHRKPNFSNDYDVITSPARGGTVKPKLTKRQLLTLITKTSFLLIVTLPSLYKLFTIAYANFDPTTFKSRLHTNLEYIDSLGAPGKALYSFLFSVWVALGIASTPIETAAGMAFGFENAVFFSGIGKFSGALLAFHFGRLFLRERIEKRFEGDQIFRIIRSEVTNYPLKVALLWRFSCFPEIVKNFGLAIMPLPAKIFYAACLIHGLPYTVLWSKAGASALNAVDGVGQSASMKLILAASAFFGLVCSPIIVGMWLNSLRLRVGDNHAN